MEITRATRAHQAKEAPMFASVRHFEVVGSFSATEHTVRPITEAGRAVFAEAFGPAAVSCNVRASQSGELVVNLTAKARAIAG